MMNRIFILLGWLAMLCGVCFAGEIPLGASPILGAVDAEVQVVVFFNFHCPHCVKELGALDSLRRSFPDRTAIVYKHFPLTSAPKSQLAHVVGQIVYDELGPEGWAGYLKAVSAFMPATDDKVIGAAVTLGVDKKLLLELISSLGMVKALLEDDAALSRRLGIRGVPAVFVNGVPHEGHLAVVYRRLLESKTGGRFAESDNHLLAEQQTAARSYKASSSLIDDLTGDCRFDLEDFAVLASVWLSDPNCAGNPLCPDRNGDNMVDIADLYDLAMKFASGTTRAPALVFIGNAIDFETGQYNQPREVCLDNLGKYDPETGALVGDNYNADLNGYTLDGFFAETVQDSLWPSLPPLAVLDNDFRIPFEGNATIDPSYSHIWAAKVNMYYHVNNFRSNFLNADFFKSLNLDPEIEKNLTTRQFRAGGYQDYPDSEESIPTLRMSEGHSLTNPRGGAIFPVENVVQFYARQRRVPAEEATIISHGFDASFVIGEFSGLLPFWITGTNKLFPPDARCITDWQFNVAGCLNDAINAWSGYRYSGDSEVYKTYRYNLKTWAARTCDDAGGIPCGQGIKIDNVMMHDESNTSGDQIFPFKNELPAGRTSDDLPVGTDRAGLYFSAVFYDISNEVGLGDYKADQLLWKTISLITDVDGLSMREFGDLILDAAAALWPNGAGGSIYDSVLVQVLSSRGIAVNGVATFHDNLPARVGSAGTLNKGNSSAFGTTHPDKQNTMALNTYAYNYKKIFSNGYTAPDLDYQYMTYSFYEHSKYGPCDKVLFTDANGTFNESGAFETFGEYNYDGGYVATFENREIANKSLFVPGNYTHWMRHRNRCANEEEAPSTIDVHSFGFIATGEMKNGFSFAAVKTSESESTVSYDLTIYDPSVSMSGPRSGAASYVWEVSDYHGAAVGGSGAELSVELAKNEPITITITRSRAGYDDDVLVKHERSNDLDRQGGRAFIVDCLNADPVTHKCK